MTLEERITIVKILAQKSMWGQGWVASTVCQALQHEIPSTPTWSELLKQYEREAEEEAVGVVTNEEEIQRYLRSDYILCNYEPGRLQVHHCRRHGGGLCTYIKGPLADKYGELYDPHNFRVYKRRAQQATGLALGDL